MSGLERRAPRALLIPVVVAAIAAACVVGVAGPAQAAPDCPVPGGCRTPAWSNDVRARFEAENFSAPTRAWHSYASPYATGGEAEIYVLNTAVGFAGFWFPRTASSVRLRLRGDSCEGPARTTMWLAREYAADGRYVDEPRRRILDDHPLPETWTTVVAPGPWRPGSYVLWVEYLNNRRTATCDRNMRWDHVDVFWAQPAA